MNNTPRNFALQLGALITLYVSLSSLLIVLFSVITLLLPDAADTSWQVERAADSIRFSTAMLIVFFPAYLWLTRRVNTIRRQEDGRYLTLTKWLIYISLLVGGGVLLGDLVAVIYGFLNGDLTVRFLLKAGILAFIISLAFYYYIKDAQSHWQSNERESIFFAIGATLLVLITLVLGFMNAATPVEVRESRIDDNQINDLQNIQWNIEEYYRANETLPASLADAYNGKPVLTAPEGRQPYTYRVVSTTSYELCGTFAQDSTENDYTNVRLYYPEKNQNWSHGQGEWCFERTVSE